MGGALHYAERCVNVSLREKVPGNFALPEGGREFSATYQVRVTHHYTGGGGMTCGGKVMDEMRNVHSL